MYSSKVSRVWKFRNITIVGMKIIQRCCSGSFPVFKLWFRMWFVSYTRICFKPKCTCTTNQKTLSLIYSDENSLYKTTSFSNAIKFYKFPWFSTLAYWIWCFKSKSLSERSYSDKIMLESVATRKRHLFSGHCNLKFELRRRLSCQHYVRAGDREFQNVKKGNS